MAARKSTRRPASKPAGRVKKTFSLDTELARLLALLAAHSGRTESDIVAESLRPTVSGYYLARKTSAEATALPMADPVPGNAA